MADVASPQYPQPQQGQQNALTANPLQMIQTLGTLQNVQRQGMEINAQKAIGGAYRNALRPDGTIDQSVLATGLRHPDAAFGLPKTMNDVISQTGGQIANTTAQFDQQAKQNQFVMSGLGALATKKNVSPEDVYNFIATTARNTNIPTNILTGWARSLPRDPKALKDALVTVGTMAAGGPASLSPTGAPIGYTPQGAPIAGTAGQFAHEAAGGGGGGSQAAPSAAPSPGGVASPAPGQVSSAETLAAGGAQAANRLREANDSSMTRKGMLGNLEEDLAHFTSGPGADYSKVAKAWINRNVPLPAGWQFDPKSIASQEQFNKQAAMLAQQQFEAIGGTGTDAKFNSAFTTSPNEVLSDLGNRGIMRLLKGNEDAIQAKNKAWLGWKKQYGPQTYDEFSQDFNSRFDPRAFQFKYLTPKERQDYIDRMDDRDRASFVSNLAAAHKQGWIKFEDGR